LHQEPFACGQFIINLLYRTKIYIGLSRLNLSPTYVQDGPLLWELRSASFQHGKIGSIEPDRVWLVAVLFHIFYLARALLGRFVGSDWP
jgi:hypothetical protein